MRTSTKVGLLLMLAATALLLFSCAREEVDHRQGSDTEIKTQTDTLDAVQEWTCGMHPNIRSSQPGKCPICNMDLVPVSEGDPGALHIDPETARLMGMQVAAAAYLPLVKTIWTVGKVDYDETRVKHVASRIGGRVERLYADFEGTRVSQGEPLLAIYSPELVTALAEYRAALEAAHGGGPDRPEAATASLEDVARAAETRMGLWGLDHEMVQSLLAADQSAKYEIPVRSPISGTVIEKHVREGEYVQEGQNLYLVADLSRVWITADIYEDDLGYVTLGDVATLKTKAFPDLALQGKIAFIDPCVDERTRSARVRIEVENAEERLKPGMYVEAKVEIPLSRGQGAVWICPMHPDVIASQPGDCPRCGMPLEMVEGGQVLAVPKRAVTRMGDLALVYVEKTPGTYQARQVELGEAGTVSGATGETFYAVLSGLAAGEAVVTDASFLVHSQARLTGKAASAYGGALDVGMAGQGHTGH